MRQGGLFLNRPAMHCAWRRSAVNHRKYGERMPPTSLWRRMVGAALLLLIALLALLLAVELLVLVLLSLLIVAVLHLCRVGQR